MEPQIWRLIAHHEAGDLAIRRSKEASRIAIGWGKIGDLSRHSAEASEIGDAIRLSYPKLNNSGQGGQCLLRFAHQMRKGDLVIISDGVRRREIAEITGDYQWTKDWSPIPGGDYWHHRAAKFWSASPPDELWKQCGGAVASGENIRWTLARLTKRALDGVSERGDR